MKIMHPFRSMLAVFAGLFFCPALAAQTTPQGLKARGFEAHVELQWQLSAAPGLSGYQIFRSTDGGQQYTFLKNASVSPAFPVIDWTADDGQNLQFFYKIKLLYTNGSASDFSDAASAQTQPMDDEALLDMTQEATFRYFWNFAHPLSGLARERNNGNPDIVTTGGSGFGILAVITGAERGWITRAQAVDRMIQIVSFLQIADRFHGIFPHWMHGATGNTIPFSQFDDGADLVESAFLFQGLLTARQYFDQNDPLEQAVRDVINDLWKAAEWDWFRKNGGPVLYWHWSPNYGWQMNFPLRGFFEAQIVYLLAAASPTHPVPGSLYQTGWTGNAGYCSSLSYFGYKYYCGGYAGGPLFFAHYSYLGFDPRGWKDACCNYFIRNRNHALIQWNYAKANPENHPGYGENAWGLTACDGPGGYSAHDIYPPNDDGTLAPTASLASMPYTPAQSLGALRHFYRDLGEKLWGPYGFYDAYNQGSNWFADSYLAIDQGPIVAMIENYRSGLFWRLFMKNPEIEPALLACGFQPDNSVAAPETALPGVETTVFPNPVSEAESMLELSFSQPETLRVWLCDGPGRVVREVWSGSLPAGATQQVPLGFEGLPGGLYFLCLKNTRGKTVVLKILKTP